MIDYVPYTNFHELNLDWIIKIIKEYVDKTDALEISYADLKEYVDNYFEDLDVQTEINNKLQEMYDSGELAVLIEQFLSTESLLVFNTLAALKAANNLASGVTAMTLGTSDLTDGLNEIYMIRSLTSADTVDEINIVSLTNYPTLVAQRLPSKKRRTYIFIGDSYIDTDDTTQSIITYIPGYMGLTSDQYYWAANSGAAFGRPDNSFQSLIEGLSGTIKHPTMITDIVVLGGYNDRFAEDEATITAAISTFKTYCDTAYPNASITLGFLGKNVNATWPIQDTLNMALSAWQKCGEFGIRYITGMENVNHDYTLFRDDLHPTAAGAQHMAKFIAAGCVNGSVDVFYNNTIELSPASDNTNVATVTGTLMESIQNSTAQINLNTTMTVTFNSAISPTSRISLAECTPRYVLPYRYLATQTCLVRAYANNVWTLVPGMIDFQRTSTDGKLTMHLNMGNQLSSVTQMQIFTGNITTPTFLC